MERLIPEERKAQIIQTALELFAQRGYEKTTVNDIIKAAGISKGGFYHHYKSKEELLEDVAGAFVAEVLAIIEQVADRDDLTALEKTNEYMRQVQTLKKDRVVEVSAFLSELYAGGKNVQLENKIFGHGQKMIAPLMKSIILQGIEEGDIKTEYPEEAAEMFVRLFIIHQREMAEAFTEAWNEGTEEAMEAIMRKYAFLQEMLENLLGLERGSLVIEEMARDARDSIGTLLLQKRRSGRRDS